MQFYFDLPSCLSSSFGYNNQKMEQQGSAYHFFGLNFRRASNALRASLLSRNQLSLYGD